MALVALVPAGGCAALSWYGDAAIGQLRLLAARRDVAEVFADPATAPETAANLERADAILAFAATRLGLAVGDRYRTYVELDREAVAWNVFAAPEFSLRPHRWCYPIVGCAVYRGFFDHDKARREADALAARGFDVHVGRVAAYSTLGWFDDPLLSTFIGYSDERLAELLFHELAHGELFVPGDSGFNEAFATFVGRQGTSEWLGATGRDAGGYLAAERAALRRADFFRAWRARLRELYAQSLPDDQRRLLKGALFDAMRACYAERRRRYGPAFGGTLPRSFNNARLAATGTYEDRTVAFAALFERAGRDWTTFYDASRELADRQPDGRDAALDDLAATLAAFHLPEDRDALLCRRPSRVDG